MIRLRFVGGNSEFSRAILVQTGGLYSHVECVTPAGKYLGALADGGVLAREPDYDAGTFDHEKFLDLPADAAMAAAFYAGAAAHIGEPYDFAAIAGFVAHMDLHAKGAVICSAFITIHLQACRWFASRLAQEPHEISPRDLFLVISGRLDVFS